MISQKPKYKTTRSFTVGDRVYVATPWYTGLGAIHSIVNKHVFVIEVDKPLECTSRYSSDHELLILTLNHRHPHWEFRRFSKLRFITKQSVTDEAFYKAAIDVV